MKKFSLRSVAPSKSFELSVNKFQQDLETYYSNVTNTTKRIANWFMDDCSKLVAFFKVLDSGNSEDLNMAIKTITELPEFYCDTSVFNAADSTIIGFVNNYKSLEQIYNFTIEQCKKAVPKDPNDSLEFILYKLHMELFHARNAFSLHWNAMKVCASNTCKLVNDAENKYDQVLLDLHQKFEPIVKFYNQEDKIDYKELEMQISIVANTARPCTFFDPKGKKLKRIISSFLINITKSKKRVFSEQVSLEAKRLKTQLTPIAGFKSNRTLRNTTLILNTALLGNNEIQGFQLIPIEIFELIVSFMPFECAMKTRLMNKEMASFFGSIMVQYWMNPVYIGEYRVYNYLPRFYMFLTYENFQNKRELVLFRNQMIDYNQKIIQAELSVTQLATSKAKKNVHAIRCFKNLVARTPESVLDKIQFVNHMHFGNPLKAYNDYFSELLDTKLLNPSIGMNQQRTFASCVNNVLSSVGLLGNSSYLPKLLKEKDKRIFAISRYEDDDAHCYSTEIHFLQTCSISNTKRRFHPECVLYHYIPTQDENPNDLLQLEIQQKNIAMWKRHYEIFGLKNLQFRLIDLPKDPNHVEISVFYCKVVCGQWNPYK